jgi:hypothetical protein
MNNDIEIIAKHLAEFFKDEPHKIVYWLLTPNPNFGNITPAWLIEHDRGHKVVQFIESSKNGDYP